MFTGCSGNLTIDGKYYILIFTESNFNWADGTLSGTGKWLNAENSIWMRMANQYAKIVTN